MKLPKLLFGSIIFLIWAAPVFADTVILPHRVIDVRANMVIDFEGLLARCAGADVVTLGENHDDPGTHMIELAVLEGLYRYNGDVSFALEMFERDVQTQIDAYLAGEISEEEFLANSRPWGNYQTDYRPMIEFSREHGLAVIAANIPRPIASRIGRDGYENVGLTDEEIPWIASTFEAPEDDGYWDIFKATMEMPGMGAMHTSQEQIWNIYMAQVSKDETMAESVSRELLANPDTTVYFICGAFHTIDYLGTFSRIERNVPSADCLSIRVIPVDDLMAPVPEDESLADYYVLVLAPDEEASEEETEADEDEVVEVEVLPENAV